MGVVNAEVGVASKFRAQFITEEPPFIESPELCVTEVDVILGTSTTVSGSHNTDILVRVNLSCDHDPIQRQMSLLLGVVHSLTLVNK